ncbi:protein SCARECROW-like protein [Corchorus olitorius]|uniref:Protein SCARECROW-like protein n=1 Tax=Corchorus olitorius TaxID=93759 RepID=A0A1R3GBZ2_9ROSI|nr:protein SCARECROW-like protein [Corchorus olitorius]
MEGELGYAGLVIFFCLKWKVSWVMSVEDIVGYRVAYWCKAKWANNVVSVVDYLRGPECVHVVANGVTRGPHVEWLSLVEVPCRFRQIMYQIEGFTKNISRWEVKHVLIREVNGVVDGLAKLSVDKGTAILTTFD